MLASVLLSFISLLVEMVGMRCTTFMAEEPEQKDKVALAGGVIFIIAGQFGSFTQSKPRVSRASRLHCQWLRRQMKRRWNPLSSNQHGALIEMLAFPGLLALIGTSWYGHRIAQEFYNPFTPTNARWSFLLTVRWCTWRHWLTHGLLSLPQKLWPFLMTFLPQVRVRKCSVRRMGGCLSHSNRRGLPVLQLPQKGLSQISTLPTNPLLRSAGQGLCLRQSLPPGCICKGALPWFSTCLTASYRHFQVFLLFLFFALCFLS